MRNTRYVKQTSSGTWDIVKEGHLRATAQRDTKRAAVKAARKLVRQEGGGEIRVVNRTGKIIDSKSISRAKKRSS